MAVSRQPICITSIHSLFCLLTVNSLLGSLMCKEAELQGIDASNAHYFTYAQMHIKQTYSAENKTKSEEDLGRIGGQNS